MNINDMIGEVLTHVDDCGDEILLTTASGKQFLLYHSQDCCENVSIQDMDGEWHKLYGKALTLVTHDEEDGGRGESSTLTTFQFKTDEHTVISRWFGESNGYYSESVSVKELK